MVDLFLPSSALLGPPSLSPHRLHCNSGFPLVCLIDSLHHPAHSHRFFSCVFMTLLGTLFMALSQFTFHSCPPPRGVWFCLNFASVRAAGWPPSCFRPLCISPSLRRSLLLPLECCLFRSCASCGLVRDRMSLYSRAPCGLLSSSLIACIFYCFSHGPGRILPAVYPASSRCLLANCFPCPAIPVTYHSGFIDGPLLVLRLASA